MPRRKRADPRQGELFGEISRLPFWQARFYDFNVWTAKKRVEKLRYMHRNPVKRGLVDSPEQWRWSSYRFYWLGEPGLVRVNEGWGKIFVCGSRRVNALDASFTGTHPFAKNAKGWGTHFIGDSKTGPPATRATHCMSVSRLAMMLAERIRS